MPPFLRTLTLLSRRTHGPSYFLPTVVICKQWPLQHPIPFHSVLLSRQKALWEVSKTQSPVRKGSPAHSRESTACCFAGGWQGPYAYASCFAGGQLGMQKWSWAVRERQGCCHPHKAIAPLLNDILMFCISWQAAKNLHCWSFEIRVMHFVGFLFFFSYFPPSSRTPQTQVLQPGNHRRACISTKNLLPGCLMKI